MAAPLRFGLTNAIPETPRFPNILSFSGSGRFLNIRMMSRIRFPNIRMMATATATRSPSPWLMLPPTFGHDMVYNFYNLSDSKVVSFNDGGELTTELRSSGSWLAVGSSHGWLVVFNRTNCNLYLTDPLSGRHLKLPSILTLPYFSRQEEEESRDFITGYECVDKVIISTSPDNHGCRALMLYGGGCLKRLAFCDPTAATAWIPLDGLYDDFVYSTREEVFYCVTRDCQLFTCDVRDPQSPIMTLASIIPVDFLQRDAISLRPWCNHKNSVVITDGGDDILLIRRHILTTDHLVQRALHRPNGSFADEIFRWDGSFDEDVLTEMLERTQAKVEALVDSQIEAQKDPMSEIWYWCYDKWSTEKTVGFDVCKYDREERRVRHMKKKSSLGGRALFIGFNHSVAVSAAAARELKLEPNSIYFTDASELIGGRTHDGGHDIGIFNYQSKTISSCYYPSDIRKIKRIDPPPIWFFPNTAAL